MGKGAETVFADISLVVYEQLAAVALGQGVFGYPFVRQLKSCICISFVFIGASLTGPKTYFQGQRYNFLRDFYYLCRQKETKNDENR